MRKLWCAGAVASGFLLLGTAPAWANEPDVPGPASAGSPSAGSPFVAGSPSTGSPSVAGSSSTGSPFVAGSSPGAPSSALGQTLDPTDNGRPGSTLASDPLSGQPLVQLEPGPGRQLARLMPGGAAQTEDTKNRKSQPSGPALPPAADVLRTVPGTAPATGSPLADGGQFSGLPVQGVPAPLAGQGIPAPLADQDLGVANLPMDGLVGRTLSDVGGLTPAGVASTSGTRTPAPDERPIAGQRLESGRAEFPLLGGLGGALPVNTLQQEIADYQSELTPMPFGGVPVAGRAASTVPDDGSEPIAAPSASAASASASPGASQPFPSTSAAGSSVTDPSVTDPSVTQPTAAEPSASASAAGGLPVAPVTPGRQTTGESTGEKPKPIGEAVIDDPRLLEEPIEGFVRPKK